MSSSFTHDVPAEFKNEDRWLKYFLPKSFITLLVTGIGAIINMKIFSVLFDLGWLGCIIGILICFVLTGSTMIKNTWSDYLNGLNLTLDDIVIKKFIHRHNSFIYVNFFENKMVSMNDDREMHYQYVKELQERLILERAAQLKKKKRKGGKVAHVKS